MEFLTTVINGLKINYLVVNPRGSKTILFLHGWGGNIDSWKSFLSQFKNSQIKAVILDLPGFGNSDFPKRPWNIKDYADFVSDFAKFLRLGDFFLFGHSFGGQIAVKYASEHPQTLSGLFLSGAAVIRPKPTVAKTIVKFVAKIIKPAFPQKIRRLIYKALGNVDYGQLESPIMKNTLSNILREDLRHLLPSLKMPIVLVWGKLDTLTPYKHALLIKEKLPQAKFYQFSDARHGLHLQKPVELKKIILENLS